MPSALTTYAAHVAPLVDAAHAAAHQLTRAGGGRDLIRRHALPHAGLLITLRFALPRAPLPRAAFPLAQRYDPPAAVLAAVDDLITAGYLTPTQTASRAAPAFINGPYDQRAASHPTPDSFLSATPAALAFIDELYDLHAAVLSAAWPQDLTLLLRLTAALLAAAPATAGPAYTVFAPPHERPADPSAVTLFNRLAAFRYHRSDAHAAAWTARGHTAATVGALPSTSSVRAEIEADTNTRAALPFAALTEAERTAFATALGELPTT